jgi:hypothetical protein
MDRSVVCLDLLGRDSPAAMQTAIAFRGRTELAREVLESHRSVLAYV